MELSEKAIQDLKQTLKNMLGEGVVFSDEEIKEVGEFLLVSLAESLKLKANSN